MSPSKYYQKLSPREIKSNSAKKAESLSTRTQLSELIHQLEGRNGCGSGHSFSLIYCRVYTRALIDSAFRQIFLQ